jgi:hypothetical protein
MTLARIMLVALGVAGACGIGGCGGRPSYWNEPTPSTPPSVAASYGLLNGVALVDDADHRIVFVTAQADQNVSTQSIRIGHNVLNVSTSSDGKRLFVLSQGDWPRQTVSDEYPSMTVVDASTSTLKSTSYRMSVPLANLALDPLGDSNGDWAVAYAGSTSTTSFVQNPNEIVLFDLNKPPSYSSTSPNPVLRTIQSFGGTPQQLVFTPTLMLPQGARRLLLIETTVDLTMLDLNHAFDQPAPRPEITVQLTSGASADQVTPAGVAVDGRDPNDPNDARIALWATNNTNVFSILLGAAPANTATGQTGVANDFAPSINLTDVGGVPSALAFVSTGGDPTAADPSKPLLRIAALVPSRVDAVLVDPDKSVTTTVGLPAPYSSFSLVTNVVGATAGAASTDVALLWNAGAGAASGIALWTLGDSVGQPYRSVDVLGATQPIEGAQKVPNQDLEILQMTNGAGFYVLDLVDRKAPPLVTMQMATLAIAPDGGRVWAFAQNGLDLSSIDFKTLNPIPLRTALPIAAVYDVARTGGGRSLIAIHTQGTVGATVFDALAPDTATSRRVPSLLLEGP